MPNERIAFRHSSILFHPRKLNLVEVVGTAPTSAMFITKFVYRRSWKTNSINIKPKFKDSININKINKRTTTRNKKSTISRK